MVKTTKAHPIVAEARRVRQATVPQKQAKRIAASLPRQPKPVPRSPAKRIAAGLPSQPIAKARSSPPPQQKASNPNLLQCASPGTRSGPSFELTLRRPILLAPPPLDVKPDVLATLRIAGTAITTKTNGSTKSSSLTPYLGLDVTFTQTWNLTDLTVGDLASTMALAPGEKVTFEFQSSQRKVLEQSTMDSTESLSSIESTTADKEAINIARSSTETEGWHVDSTATLTCGFAKLSVSAGYNKSVTDSNSQAISHIHDTTVHSAKSLKALHKIEVKGVTETSVSNRMTRTIENPYFDRCVSLNVFHLLKQFSVQTALSEMRYAIVLVIDDLTFDNDFVLNGTDFLQSNLLDSSLLDDLPVAIQGAKPPLTQTASQAAKETAKRALAFLFDPPFDSRPTAHDLFHLPPIPDPNGQQPGGIAQTVLTSLTQNLMGGSLQGTGGKFLNSGFGKSNDQHCIQIFTILGFFYGLIQEMVDNPDPVTQVGTPKINILEADQNAVNIAVALAAGVGAVYKDVFTDPLKSTELINVMKEDALTEVIRRVPGFLTMVSGILQPLLDPAKVEQAALADYAQAQFVLQRLIKHLKCNRHYYVQRYLRYVAKVTANQAIVDFATDALNAIVNTPGVLPADANGNPVVAIGDFDLDRTFIDKREVVIPGFVALSNDVVTTLVQTVLGDKDLLPVVDPGPQVVNDLEVAADGIHMEVAEGACPPLKNVPAPQPGASITVKDLQASINN